MCVCAYVCACSWMHMHFMYRGTQAYVYACRRQESPSNAFLYHSPLHSMKSLNVCGSPTGLTLITSARLAGQRDPGVCLPLPLSTGFTSLLSHDQLLMQTSVFGH